jgi:hypothetical protein
MQDLPIYSETNNYIKTELQNHSNDYEFKSFPICNISCKITIFRGRIIGSIHW